MSLDVMSRDIILRLVQSVSRFIYLSVSLKLGSYEVSACASVFVCVCATALIKVATLMMKASQSRGSVLHEPQPPL